MITAYDVAFRVPLPASCSSFEFNRVGRRIRRCCDGLQQLKLYIQAIKYPTSVRKGQGENGEQAVARIGGKSAGMPLQESSSCVAHPSSSRVSRLRQTTPPTSSNRRCGLAPRAAPEGHQVAHKSRPTSREYECKHSQSLTVLPLLSTSTDRDVLCTTQSGVALAAVPPNPSMQVTLNTEVLVHISQPGHW